MSALPLPDGVLISALNALQSALGSKASAAKQIGVNPSTFNHRVRVALSRGLHPTSAKPTVRVKALSAPADAMDVIERREFQQSGEVLRRRNVALETQIVEERRWRRQFESLSQIPESAAWRAAPAVHGSSTHVVQLFTSDFQCGERINPAEIDGINEFNQDIFIERYQRMIDKTIDLAVNHTGATDFDGCIYLGGGDAINGEIHEELTETNDLSSIPALRLLCQQEAEGLRRLRDAFGRVRVYRVPGNHGRTTKKPRSNGYTERNYETLLAWWLASKFENDPRVEFFIPPSGDAYYDVMGWKFLMSHGDRMGSRGGQGFIGPAATIARGHAKLYNNYTQTGRPVDWILTGHLHTELKLERGFANGALVGYNAYARDLRATPDAARQWMFLTHETRPVAHQFSIQLSAMPRRTLITE